MIKKFLEIIGLLENKNKYQLLALTFFICITALFEVFAVYMFGNSVSLLTEGNDSVLEITGLSTTGVIMLSCLLIISSGLLISYVLYYRAKVAFRIGGFLSLIVLRNKVKSNIIDSKLSEIMNDVTFETDRFARSFISELLQFITRGFIAISLIVYILFFLDSILFLFIFFVVIIYIVMALYLKSRVHDCGKIITKQNEKRYQLVKNAYLGIRDFRTLNRFDFIFDKFDKVAEKYNSANAKVQYYALVPRYLIEAIVLSIVLIALLMKNTDSSVATMNVELVSSSFLAIMKLLPQISQAYQSLSNLIANRVSLERIHNSIFRSEILSIENKTLRKNNTGKTSIQLDALKFSYGDKVVFEDLSFTFDVGHVNIISGISGSGKSTLLDIICGFKVPSEGKILTNLNDLSRDGISYTSQTPFMFDGTIYENLTLGNNISADRCWEALNLVDLADLIQDVNSGLDTELGENGMKLSGGQTQRLSIARALCFDSAIQIYDEPTSALDEDTSTLIMNNLERVARNRLVIIVTHNKQYFKNRIKLEL